MKNKFLSFAEARSYVRGQKLKSMKEWMKWRKTRPPYIPSNPHQVYKEWISYCDWMGFERDRFNQNRKYDINSNFFDKWSHDMSYVLGFWWADGCMFDSLFSISQKKEDGYILQDIAQVMGYKGPIRVIRDKYCILDINSRQITNAIFNMGGEEKKSLKCKLPYIPSKYFCDFVRGVFDGDGSISVYDYGAVDVSITSGSNEFVYALCNALIDHIKGIDCKVSSLKGKYYRIRISKKNAILFGDYIYSSPSSLYLKRKQKKFKEAEKYAVCDFMSYEDSLKYVHRLGLKSKTEWELFCKMGLRPINIPSTPSKRYKDCGWYSWKEWLGYEKQRVKGGKSCWAVS